MESIDRIPEAFSRTARVWGEDAVANLAGARVAVFGNIVFYNYLYHYITRLYLSITAVHDAGVSAAQEELGPHQGRRSKGKVNTFFGDGFGRPFCFSALL